MEKDYGDDWIGNPLLSILLTFFGHVRAGKDFNECADQASVHCALHAIIDDRSM